MVLHIFDDVTYIIFIGDNVGADRKTLIFDTVYLDDLVFPSFTI